MQTTDTVSGIRLGEFAEALGLALAEKTPCVVGTSSADGDVDLSLKASVLVLDDDHLALWERSHGATLENLRQNPRVAVLYRNAARGVPMRRFYGTAELHERGDLRATIRARVVPEELAKDPDDRGIAVVIRIDRVMDGSRTIQRREESTRAPSR